MFFANRAAHRMAGGAFPLDRQMPEFERVAAGERLENIQVEWQSPAGVRSLMASGDTITPPGERPSRSSRSRT